MNKWMDRWKNGWIDGLMSCHLPCVLRVCYYSRKAILESLHAPGNWNFGSAEHSWSHSCSWIEPKPSQSLVRNICVKTPERVRCHKPPVDVFLSPARYGSLHPLALKVTFWFWLCDLTAFIIRKWTTWHLHQSQCLLVCTRDGDTERTSDWLPMKGWIGMGNRNICVPTQCSSVM